MIALDHVAMSGETLAEAQTAAEMALGVPLQAGGEHDVFFTHNVLLGLQDGLYFEAIAKNPNADEPKRARWFDLDNFSGAPRLTNWICRCDDLEETLKAFPASVGLPVALKRGDLSWRMAVPESGCLPFGNLFPALIQWDTKITPAQTLATSPVSLKRLTIQHPEVDALAALLEPHLSDNRITFKTGPTKLSAVFETPKGVVQL